MVRIDAIETYQRTRYQDTGGVDGCQLIGGLGVGLGENRSQTKPQLVGLVVFCLLRVRIFCRNGVVDSKGIRWVRFFSVGGCGLVRSSGWRVGLGMVITYLHAFRIPEGWRIQGQLGAGDGV
jgi:hypothetical protein